MPSYDYQIGASLILMENVEDIIGEAPRLSAFRPWAVQRISADGTVRSDGGLNFEWTFDYLTREMLFNLLSSVGLLNEPYYWYYDAAINVYVRNRTPFGGYDTFLAQMILPDGWEFELFRGHSVVIRFTNAIFVED